MPFSKFTQQFWFEALRHLWFHSCELLSLVVQHFWLSNSDQAKFTPLLIVFFRRILPWSRSHLLILLPLPLLPECRTALPKQSMSLLVSPFPTASSVNPFTGNLTYLSSSVSASYQNWLESLRPFALMNTSFTAAKPRLSLHGFFPSMIGSWAL